VSEAQALFKVLGQSADPVAAAAIEQHVKQAPDRELSCISMRHDEYACALRAAGYEATLDEMVEVAFTVSTRVRRIEAHDPDTLPFSEYLRQIFWSSGVDLPEDDAYERLLEEIVIDTVELAP